MAQPTNGSSRRTSDELEGASGEMVLSWSEVAALAVVRLVALTGERLLFGVVDSATGTTRTLVSVVGDPSAPFVLVTAGRDRLVELVREALGIVEIEATLRRLTGDAPGAGAAGTVAVSAPPRGAVPAAAITSGEAPGSVPAPASPPAPAEPEDEGPADEVPADEVPADGGPADEVEAGEAGAGEVAVDERGTTADDPPAEAQGPVQAPAAGPAPGVEPERPELRERARQLLAQSATLADDEQHPAFGVVLEELAPDEVRILRVFARDGDQPVVDVESRGPLGGRGRLVAERVSLLSEVAGCKHPERLPVYLDNLERLRLIRVVAEPLDASDYEVIEAQDAAFSARDRGARGAASARFLRRRLALSAFGAAFCRCCLPA